MGITLIFTLCVAVVIAVFDVFIIFSKGKQASISALIIRSSHKYPSIPFLFGFLCGHLFWSMNTADWAILP
jgi:hypothetical protein